MSGIGALLTRTCTQTAVYWGSPQDNGFGKYSYAAPVEILCRWEGKVQYAKGWDMKGFAIEYIGLAYVLQDLDENGCLFLGTLADLVAGADVNPIAMDKVYLIKQFEKVPALGSTTEFMRTAYLTMFQYR